MGNMFDIIGAFLIFVAVVLMTLQLNISTMEKNTQSMLQNANAEAINGTESFYGLGGIIEHDLSKVGLADSISPAITVADSDKITFRGDVTGDGVADSVRYFVNAPSSIPVGTNPNLKYLYRRQNTETGTKGWWGVSSFKLSYLDNMGRPIPAPVQDVNLPLIRSIRVQVMMESAVRLRNDRDTSFAATYWETIISPPNVK